MFCFFVQFGNNLINTQIHKNAPCMGPPSDLPEKNQLSFDNANNKLLRAWRLWPCPLCHMPLLLLTDGPVWATMELLHTFFRPRRNFVATARARDTSSGPRH